MNPDIAYYHKHACQLYLCRVTEGQVRVVDYGDHPSSVKAVVLDRRGHELYKMVNENLKMTMSDWCEIQILQSCRMAMFQQALVDVYGGSPVSNLYALGFSKLILESEDQKYLANECSDKFNDALGYMRYAAGDNFKLNQSLTGIAECARYDAFLERRRADVKGVITDVLPPLSISKMNNMLYGAPKR